MTEPDKNQSEWDKILRQAWLSSSLERDKAIITLSSAGLGVLVAFVTKVSAIECLARLALLIGIVGFTVSILAGVRCLHKNREFVERELRRESEDADSPADWILVGGFVAGILSVAAIGVGVLISL